MANAVIEVDGLAVYISLLLTVIAKGAFPALICALSTMPRNFNAGNASHW